MQVTLANLIAAQAARPSPLQGDAKPAQAAPFRAELDAQTPAFEPLPLARVAPARAEVAKAPAAGTTRPGAHLDITV